MASILLKRRTTIVGTVRNNRLHLPRESLNEPLQLHGSSFHWNNREKQLLVQYKCKPKKHVILISNLHDKPSVDDTRKRKPNVIRFYNKHKCGVDIVDSMLRMYSTRSTSRKWTTAVWQNILDIVALNAWICYKEVICGQLSRKHFIFSLAKELREQYMSYKNIPRCWTLCGNKPPNPKRQKCKTSGCTNRSSIVCSSCERIFCGPCCSEPVRVVRTSICFQCTNRS